MIVTWGDRRAVLGLIGKNPGKQVRTGTEGDAPHRERVRLHFRQVFHHKKINLSLGKGGKRAKKTEEEESIGGGKEVMWGY